MLRAIKNVFFLLLVCITASSFPLYVDSFQLSSFSPAPVDSLSFQIQERLTLTSEIQIDAILSTEAKELPIEFSSDNPISIDLYYGEQHLKKLDAKSFISNFPDLNTTITSDTPVQFQLDFPQSLLNIPDGDYLVTVKPNINNTTLELEPQTIPLSFRSEGTYIPALHNIARNETALSLYFPDNEYNHLIPVTRVIPYTTTVLRNTLNNLESGPDPSLGLREGSPVPKGATLNLSSGLVSVYLPRDLGGYDQGSASSYIAVYSFVESLTSIPNVNSVQFYFNNRIAETGFHDMSMDKPYYPSESPKLFVKYVTDTNRYLLLPIPTSENNASVDSLFKKLKYSNNYQEYNSRTQPTVPEKVELLDHSIEGNLLRLTFNEQLLTAHRDSKDDRLLMIESILYTFDSLKEIESIQLEIQNSSADTLEGYPLNAPIKVSRYINPEK